MSREATMARIDLPSLILDYLREQRAAGVSACRFTLEMR